MKQEFLNETFETMSLEDLRPIQEEKFLRQMAYVWQKSPFYRKKFKTGVGLCPVAESVTRQIISLPIYPEMNNRDVEKVAQMVFQTVRPRCETLEPST